ncbi:MAG TPA: hypothetical protein VKG89_08875 [Solirubrobacterales bacterium]|nr:hypothetical protein [Solirubrobacterales bacterium]
MSIRLTAPPAGLLACVIALTLLAPNAGARSVTAELRVEGPGVTLDPGTWYVTSSERIDRGSSSKCKANGRHATLDGPTALGILAPFSKLDPDGSPLLARTDAAIPGELLLCRVGKFKANQAFTKFWNYWVNYVPPSVGASSFRLHRHDHVLWSFGVVTGTFGGPNDFNTGDALELRSAVASTPGAPITVTVIRHPFFGDPSRAAGVTVSGGDAPVTTDANGHANVTVSHPGFATLVATDRPDVPSNRLRVCVNADPAKCPVAFGKTIVGSQRGDRIRGTRGWDRIKARGGRDVITIRNGGRDRVNCGGGRDRVVVDHGDGDDRIAKSCERVIKR